MPYTEEDRRQQARESAARKHAAMQDPRPASAGGGWQGAAAPAAPARGLVAKGFSEAEIRRLHDAAGAPQTERRAFGVDYGD